MSKPYLQHLKSSSDLRTTYEATRAGFVALALEKNRRATPFVAEARALKTAAAMAKSPKDLLAIEGIRPALITAAGVSDKALNHLPDEDQAQAVEELLAKFLEPAGSNFVEELVFRFLLIRGDTLGGSMRNIGGFLAQCKLARALIACLRVGGRQIHVLTTTSKKWSLIPSDDTDIENILKGLSWNIPSSSRTLFFNRNVPLVNKNVDLVLLNCAYEEFSSKNKAIAGPAKYVALGELKGGIDPAGADEHYKTAGSALRRIARAFASKGVTPHLFYVGGAIEAAMADELWEDLESGHLSNAANLTSDEQVASVAQWICSV